MPKKDHKKDENPINLSVEPTRFHEFPWIVILGRTTQDILIADCIGSIISPNYVLTAAHCVYDKPVKKLWCIAGVDNLKEYTNGNEGIKVGVNDIIVHEGYREHASGLVNDIALIKLEQPLPLGTREVDAIQLPAKDIDYYGEIAVTAGWDMNITNRNKTMLKKKLQLWSLDKCNELLDKQVFEEESLLGAGNRNVPPCYGDSGGPLMIKNVDGHYELAGLVSFGRTTDLNDNEGHECICEYYYVNVEHYENWIRLHTQGENYLWGDCSIFWLLQNIIDQ